MTCTLQVLTDGRKIAFIVREYDNEETSVINHMMPAEEGIAWQIPSGGSGSSAESKPLNWHRE